MLFLLVWDKDVIYLLLLLWFPRYFDWSPFLWNTAEVVKESRVTMQHCVGTVKLIVNFTDWTEAYMGMSLNFCYSFCTASQQFGRRKGKLPHLKHLSYQGANVAITALQPPLLSLVYYNFHRLLKELKKVSWFYDVPNRFNAYTRMTDIGEPSLSVRRVAYWRYPPLSLGIVRW